MKNTTVNKFPIWSLIFGFLGGLAFAFSVIDLMLGSQSVFDPVWNFIGIAAGTTSMYTSYMTIMKWGKRQDEIEDQKKDVLGKFDRLN